MLNFSLTQRIKDAFLDPVRRRNVLSRCAETLIPSSLILAWPLGWWSLPASLGVLLGEFLLYELILEPMKLTGHYWERGPRDGETFTRW